MLHTAPSFDPYNVEVNETTTAYAPASSIGTSNEGQSVGLAKQHSSKPRNLMGAFPGARVSAPFGKKMAQHNR